MSEILDEIRRRASLVCETDEDFAQAEADRDTLLEILDRVL